MSNTVPAWVTPGTPAAIVTYVSTSNGYVPRGILDVEVAKVLKASVGLTNDERVPLATYDEGRDRFFIRSQQRFSSTDRFLLRADDPRVADARDELVFLHLRERARKAADDISTPSGLNDPERIATALRTIRVWQTALTDPGNADWVARLPR